MKTSLFLTMFTFTFSSSVFAANSSHFWNTQQKAAPTTSSYQEVSFDDYIAEQNAQVIRQTAKPPQSAKTRDMSFMYGFSNSTFDILNENVQGTFSSIGLNYHQELQPNVGYGAGYKLFLPKSIKSIEFSIHQFQGTFYVNNPLQDHLNLRLEGGLAPRLVSAKRDGSKSDQMITHGIASIGLLYASNENVMFGMSPEIRLPILSEKVEKTSYDLNFMIGAQF